MIQTQIYEIAGCDDAELEIKSDRKLKFRLTYDDSKEIKALINIIAGTNEDSDDRYIENLANTLAKELDIAVINVEYFGLRNNFPYAKLTLDEIDRLILKTVCKTIGFELPNDFDSDSFDDVRLSQLITKDLYKFIEQQKLNGKLGSTYKLPVHVTLAPPNDQYQNFGIMQAIDIINASLHIKANPPFKLHSNDLAMIFVGSSHGGYLASLCSKIAPWAVDGVIDNSGWNLSTEIFDNKSWGDSAFCTIGFGKEIDYTKYHRANKSDEHINLCLSDKTMWTSDESSDRYFSRSRYEIRDLRNLKHMPVWAKSKKGIFKAYHSTKDMVTLINPKMRFYESLQAFNFDATIELISHESQIDGEFIKDLHHGMGMDISQLVLKNYEWIMQKIAKRPNSKRAKSIEYETTEWIYKFKERDSVLSLECNPKN